MLCGYYHSGLYATDADFKIMVDVVCYMKSQLCVVVSGALIYIISFQPITIYILAFVFNFVFTQTLKAAASHCEWHSMFVLTQCLCLRRLSKLDIGGANALQNMSIFPSVHSP